MNIVLLYDQFSTHTNTVFDHLDSFRKFSKHKYYYIHAYQDHLSIDWQDIDVVIIHYSVRVAHKLIPKKLYDQIKCFSGFKILFLQDEYENTNESIKAIKELKVEIVYTCVPKKYIHMVYPIKRLKNT